MGVDLRYLRDERRYRVEGDTYYLRESTYWKPIEIGLCERADVAYFFSTEEIREVARHAPNAVARAIPLFLGDSAADDGLPFDERRDLLFVGNFSHAPNVDALRWFIEEVLPKVRNDMPTLRVVAVGANCPRDLEDLIGDRVLFAGAVSTEELHARYRSCRLAIAPLRYGAGIKGKVVEAIQLGVPIVTTSIGSEGLPDTTGVLPIADTAEEFARRIVQIAGDEACWQGVRAGLRRYAVSHFSREVALRVVADDMGLSEGAAGG
jgi:glycosyltransferase involved in cell wall biosynthesis